MENHQRTTECPKSPISSSNLHVFVKPQVISKRKIIIHEAKTLAFIHYVHRLSSLLID